ncbi:MAG: SUF system NifU family Fe-S cluster assembly protein [Gammaproteobacteria bacterium]|nr:SUF system NifU family Fe-S cluster assembly protein [Gammaproteobacteria bacterium]NND37034.1 SUF system NifU family Fe-S cluster assembly protein [Gammaproteobacteria bacterium]
MTATVTSELQDLYRQTVLDHSRRPRNFRRMMDASAAAEGHNPLCGDKITVYVRIDDDSIADVSFEGVGCAISQASASIMTEQVAHGTKAEAKGCIEEVMKQFDRGQEDPPVAQSDMAALAGVRAYPSRIKCATLAWKTLRAALEGKQKPVTTEE